MYNFCNLPRRTSKTEIVGTPLENGDFAIFAKQDHFSVTICTICGTSPESIARGIADAIKNARDVGFEQGREYVHRAISGEVRMDQP